jgi:ribosomal protein S18 acetylase RimI-like enzyme
LASHLIEWVFSHADEKGLVVYLDTASDNPAMRLYKRLGFEERGSRTIEDLSKYGGEGSETHVALTRHPKSKTG